MGVDLRLLPMDSQSVLCNFCCDVLSFDRDSQLFELIAKAETEKGIDVQRCGIKSFLGIDKKTGEHCYGITEIDSYGNRIKSLLASELKVVFSAYKTDDWKNKAIFAFVSELPDNLPIYLYWH